MKCWGVATAPDFGQGGRRGGRGGSWTVGWFKILKFEIYILLKVAPVPYIILYFMAKFEAIKTKSRGRYDLQLL